MIKDQNQRIFPLVIVLSILTTFSLDDGHSCDLKGLYCAHFAKSPVAYYHLLWGYFLWAHSHHPHPVLASSCSLLSFPWRDSQVKQIHERAWKWSPSTKVTHGRNRESFVTFLPVSPLLARGEFSRALTYFARSTIPKRKLGTIRSGTQL